MSNRSQAARRPSARLTTATLLAAAIAAAIACGEDQTPTGPNLAVTHQELTVSPGSLQFTGAIPQEQRLTVTSRTARELLASTSDPTCATVSPSRARAVKTGRGAYATTFSVRSVGEAACAIVIRDKQGHELRVPVEIFTASLRLRSPDVTLPAFQEITYCYYFRTANTAALAVKQWRSRLSAGVLDMRLVLTTADVGVPGTQSAANCSHLNETSAASAGAIAYTAYQSAAAFDFPADDGAGTPVAQRVRAAQAGYLRIHFHNPGQEPLVAHAELDGVAYPSGTVVTLADSYVTFDGKIELLPQSSTSESLDCPTPPDALFIRLSTHAHKQAVHTSISDQAAVLFESTDFANPGERMWTAPPFQSISGDLLTMQCDYVNPTNRTIRTGPSVATDEVCMAVTLYFPSDGAKVCYGVAQGVGVFDANKEPGT
jgi:hypothetical protein